MKWNKYIEFLKLTFFGLLTGSIFFAVYFFYNFTLTQNLSYRSRAETAMADSSQCTTGCWTGASKLCYAIGECNTGFCCTNKTINIPYPHFEPQEIKITSPAPTQVVQIIPSPSVIPPLVNVTPDAKPAIYAAVSNNDQNRVSGLIYYSQLDSKFNQETGENAVRIPDQLPNPSSYCRMQDAGCGQTTVAMILASFIDKNINPLFVAKTFPYTLATCAGTALEWHEQILTKYGIKTQMLFNGVFPEKDLISSENKALIDQYLRDGWLVIAKANIYLNGHFLILVKSTPNGYITYDSIYGYGKYLPEDFTKDAFGQTLNSKYLPHIISALAVRKN